jgi:hypothetical protein
VTAALRKCIRAALRQRPAGLRLRAWALRDRAAAAALAARPRQCVVAVKQRVAKAR